MLLLTWKGGQLARKITVKGKEWGADAAAQCMKPIQYPILARVRVSATLLFIHHPGNSWSKTEDGPNAWTPATQVGLG